MAFRDAANSLERIVIDNHLKSFFKRLSAKKSRLVAITATARKIAIIIWNMHIQKKEEYNPLTTAKREEHFSQKENEKYSTIYRSIWNKTKGIGFCIVI